MNVDKLFCRVPSIVYAPFPYVILAWSVVVGVLLVDSPIAFCVNTGVIIYTMVIISMRLANRPLK